MDADPEGGLDSARGVPAPAIDPLPSSQPPNGPNSPWSAAILTLSKSARLGVRVALEASSSCSLFPREKEDDLQSCTHEVGWWLSQQTIPPLMEIPPHISSVDRTSLDLSNVVVL